MRNAELGMRNEDANAAGGMGTSRATDATPGSSHSASLATAFWVLVGHSFQRHWRVRGMAGVAGGLLALTAGVVAAVSMSAAGWGLEDRRVRRQAFTYREYGEQLRPKARYDALEPDPTRVHDYGTPPARQPSPVETPTPLDPFADSLKNLVLSIPHAVMQSEPFLRDWRVMNFSRLVVSGAYLAFVLPLFTLAYASGAIGTERETRSLIWLTTRPIPRGAIYLAKWLGTLPWCLLFGGGGFAVLCLAGGPPGREALALYWPAAAGATVALSALFHLIGALFRRPVVVGLVYVFFFEALVAVLPGSLKLLSLTFYARSLMYNEAAAAGYRADMLDVPGAVSAPTAWAVLAAATLGFTAVGVWLFARAEYRDDV